MELELGLGLPQYYNGCLKKKNDMISMEITSKTQKRSFSQAFQDSTLEKKPLLVSWGDKPNKEDEEDDERKKSNSFDMGEVEDNHVVGWPPVNSLRKKLLWRRNKQGGRIWNNRHYQTAAVAAENSSYVKVKMDGVAIGRKIDLQLYDSYETLKSTLIDMFAKYHRCNMMNSSSRCYSLTYQDKDGDWMLAGDVPWKTFMETVRRLEIVKTSGG